MDVAYAQIRRLLEDGVNPVEKIFLTVYCLVGLVDQVCIEEVAERPAQAGDTAPERGAAALAATEERHSHLLLQVRRADVCLVICGRKTI